MQDIETLRDYILADEIHRIESLTHVELVRELIELQSQKIESLSKGELLTFRKPAYDVSYE